MSSPIRVTKAAYCSATYSSAQIVAALGDVGRIRPPPGEYKRAFAAGSNLDADTWWALPLGQWP